TNRGATARGRVLGRPARDRRGRARSVARGWPGGRRRGAILLGGGRGPPPAGGGRGGCGGARAGAGFPCDRIVPSRGQVRVDQLAGEVGWSRKRLWTRFRSQIRLTPQRAAPLGPLLPRR